MAASTLVGEARQGFLSDRLLTLAAGSPTELPDARSKTVDAAEARAGVPDQILEDGPRSPCRFR